jgi:hypothetical protein
MRAQSAFVAALAMAWLYGGAAAQNAGAEGGTPPAPERRDDPSENLSWRDRVAAARERHAAWLACVSAKLSHCAPRPSEEREDPMGRLLDDDTLRPGDVVSTPEGLKVFRGQAGAPHRLEDFW